MKINKKIMVSTYIVFIIILILYENVFKNGSDHQYSIETVFYLKNAKGAMVESDYPISFFDSDKDRISFLFKIHNNNERKINYSLAVMINDYQLQDDKLEYDTDEKSFYIEPGDSMETTIYINKEVFTKSVNEMVLIVRQDADKHADYFGYNIKSNTIYLCYRILCDETKNKNDSINETYIKSNTRINIEPLGKVDSSSKFYLSNGLIGIKITIEDISKKNYKIYCLFNSEVKKIDNKPYTMLSTYDEDTAIVDIDVSKGEKLNEIEFFAIPVDSFGSEYILRSERYTIVNEDSQR